jgi:membrane-associated phospholipid phosphatase
VNSTNYAHSFAELASFVVQYGMIFTFITILLSIRVLLSPVTKVWAHLAREICLAMMLYFVYYLVRGIVKDQVTEAHLRAHAIVDLERSLGLFQEPAVQAWALNHELLIRFVNWIYVWWFWPPIIFGLSWLFLHHREHYEPYRNALLISGAMGLVVFALFPVAPPRFLAGIDVIDTVTQRSVSSHVLLPQGLSNKYAAMPSLHAGWTFLMGIAFVRHARHPLAQAFGVALPLCMFASIVVTGNHFIIDGIVGQLFALTALLLAYELQRRRVSQTEHERILVPVRVESGERPHYT